MSACVGIPCHLCHTVHHVRVLAPRLAPVREGTPLPVTAVRPPFDAALIERKRKQAGKSAREAAIAAGLSPTHWREVERGLAAASAETMARMASVIWVTPEELDTAQRPDAAAELRRLLDAEPPDLAVTEVRALAERIAAQRGMTEGQKRRVTERMLRALEDDSPLPSRD